MTYPFIKRTRAHESGMATLTVCTFDLVLSEDVMLFHLKLAWTNTGYGVRSPHCFGDSVVHLSPARNARLAKLALDSFKLDETRDQNAA